MNGLYWRAWIQHRVEKKHLEYYLFSGHNNIFYSKFYKLQLQNLKGFIGAKVNWGLYYKSKKNLQSFDGVHHAHTFSILKSVPTHLCYCFVYLEIVMKAPFYQKWPLYCPRGSGTLRQQLLMMHGIAWYCLVLHCIA